MSGRSILITTKDEGAIESEYGLWKLAQQKVTEIPAGVTPEICIFVTSEADTPNEDIPKVLLYLERPGNFKRIADKALEWVRASPNRLVIAHSSGVYSQLVKKSIFKNNAAISKCITSFTHRENEEHYEAIRTYIKEPTLVHFDALWDTFDIPPSEKITASKLKHDKIKPPLTIFANHLEHFIDTGEWNGLDQKTKFFIGTTYSALRQTLYPTGSVSTCFLELVEASAENLPKKIKENIFCWVAVIERALPKSDEIRLDENATQEEAEAFHLHQKAIEFIRRMSDIAEEEKIKELREELRRDNIVLRWIGVLDEALDNITHELAKVSGDK